MIRRIYESIKYRLNPKSELEILKDLGLIYGKKLTFN